MPNIIATAQVKNGALSTHSSGVSFENGILHFPNSHKSKFIPIISDCVNAPYITTTHWIKEIGPDYIVVMQKALDTGDRTSAPSDFTAAIVSLD